MASRLGFVIDAPLDAAIIGSRAEITRSAPARLIEEFYKLLRSGASEQAFRMMAERKLLEPIAHDLQKGASERLWRSLAALDAYRKRHDESPDTLTNAVLLGSLLVPLGLIGHARDPARSKLAREPRLSLGMLPLARRDVERFYQILGLQRRLIDPGLSPRARRALMHRGPFREALAWLEIHGESPGALEHWRGFLEASGVAASAQEGIDVLPRPRRRRRRRRRSFRSVTN
jgi:poly(A) polymerase